MKIRIPILSNARLSTKLILGFLTASIIPILAISFFSYRSTEQYLIEAATNEIQLDVNVHVSEINLKFDTFRNQLLFLAITPPVQGIIRSQANDGVDPFDGSTREEWLARLNSIFRSIELSNQEYTQLRFIDESGQEIVRVDRKDGAVVEVGSDQLQYKGDRYYFTDAMKLKNQQLYVSPIDLNKEGSPPTIIAPYEPTVRYATPIFDISSGERKGIVIANINVSSLLSGLHALSGDLRSEENRLESEYIIDSEGYFLLNTDHNKEWGGPQDLNSGYTIDDQFSDMKSFLFSADKGSAIINDRLVTFASIIPDYSYPENRYIFFEDIPREFVIKPAMTLRSYLIGLVLAIVIVVTFLSFVLSRSISKPIEALQKSAEKIGQGDLDHKVSTGRIDEIGSLEATFDQMIDAIKESREQVNKKVEEQTRVIKEKNQAYEDQQTALLNVLEDVEEEKEKVERGLQDLEKFRLAAESATDAVVITDADARIVYVNPAVEKITGFTQKESIGKKAGGKELWGGLMDKRFYENLWRTVKVKKKPFVGDVRNKRKNGEEYDALARISPILDRNGRVIYFVALERDITKEKDIDRAKTEFVSLASHQLRTPLSAINWYTEMLIGGDAGKLNKEQLQYLDEIYKGNQRMVSLVNSLLNVSRIELGTFIVEPEKVKLQDIAESVLNELKPQIDKKKLKIKKRFGKDMKDISVDPKLMRIVFQNYLSNAVKYTKPTGTIELIINIMKGQAVISVKDNGMGIPSNQKDKIFTKLFRADNVRAADTEGTGLGLYIVKAIIENTGGRVWFKSVENKGTTFYASLPKSGMKKKEGSRKLA